MAQVVGNKEQEKKITNIRYQRDKDREKVRGVFKNYESPGGTLTFPYRKYKGDSIETYVLKDGEVCTIPLGVAKHLNNNCWYPVYDYIDGDSKIHQGFSDNKVMKITRKVHRFGFQSLEFVDIDDLADNTKPIMEVTYATNP